MQRKSLVSCIMSGKKSDRIVVADIRSTGAMSYEDSARERAKWKGEVALFTLYL